VSGFPRKFGAAWTAPNAKRTFDHDFQGLEAEDYADIEFTEREQPGVSKPYTFHVDRGKFDLLLLQHAHELGAQVYEGLSVKSVDFSGDHPDVRFEMGGKEMGVTARMVVDASGRRTLLGGQLGWKVKDPVFDQFALHTWFGGYDRSVVAQDGRQDYIFIHFLPVSNSWVWQIPITDDITSIGVVTQKGHFAKRKSDQGSFFWDSVGSRPEFAEALRASEQLRPFKTEGDYSYAMSQIAGDKVVLIGDAARFVDPIFSTGVSIALNSARFASRDIVAAIESGDTSRAAFNTYVETISRGTKNWYDFITLYYRLNVLFTAFVLDKRYRLDIIKLLQGDVYDDDAPEVLAKMREIVTQVESNERHPWHRLLGDLTANAFAPAF
jgi:FADH2 O2-dependent halogenase